MDTNLLPPYVVRKSSRARRLQLKITAEGELHLVVPNRISLKQAQLFLLENLPWVQARSHLLQGEKVFVWPDQVTLQAIECSWLLSLQFSAKRVRLDESVECVKVVLRDKSPAQFKRVMARWLKRKAELELTPWLLRLSRQCELPFGTLRFKGQKTQWGNCSRQGDICLNYKLLFLPAHYVEYVMIHELCHTKHFNHSKKFWMLVGAFVSDWRSLAKEVRRADQLLPEWIK